MHCKQLTAIPCTRVSVALGVVSWVAQSAYSLPVNSDKLRPEIAELSQQASSATVAPLAALADDLSAKLSECTSRRYSAHLVGLSA